MGKQDGGVFYIITIRQEQPSDYKEVHNLVTQAFATTVYGDGTEADYLGDLRKKNTFIPELSLVAENHDGCIVGQIVMYRTLIETGHGPVEALVLSPISVHPDHFRKGIARALIKSAVDRATCMGFIAVFLCGEPKIYTNLGFHPTYEFGITHISDSSAQWCMGMELSLGSLAGVTGTLDIV